MRDAKSMVPSRVCISHANSHKWVKTERVRDVMPILFICKFDDVSIKNEVAVVRTTFFPIIGL